MRRRISKSKSVNTAGSRSLFVLTLALAFLGILVIADVSAPLAQASFGDSFYFAKQQAVWVVVGTIVLVVSSRINSGFWIRIAPVVFLLSILALVAVLIPGVGSKFLGARRWIIFGPINFQPSEFVKLALALFLSYLYQKKAPFYLLIVSIVLPVGLIMLQPDLGTAVVVSLIGVSQIFLTGVSILWFLGILTAGGILGTVLIWTSDYRRVRLMTYLKNSVDPLGASYHLRQILIALGSGGLFGVGIGGSRQKYLFLPETATDSVFAVLAEEVGFVGSLAVIAVLFYFLIKCLKICFYTLNDSLRLLAVGITSWLGGQILLNLASVTALVPLTGIPLPFFSYGGSSLVMIFFAVGILLNISRYGQKRI